MIQGSSTSHCSVSKLAFFRSAFMSDAAELRRTRLTPPRLTPRTLVEPYGKPSATARASSGAGAATAPGALKARLKSEAGKMEMRVENKGDIVRLALGDVEVEEKAEI